MVDVIRNHAIKNSLVDQPIQLVFADFGEGGIRGDGRSDFVYFLNGIAHPAAIAAYNEKKTVQRRYVWFRWVLVEIDRTSARVGRHTCAV